jgi:hypothetical protein
MVENQEVDGYALCPRCGRRLAGERSESLIRGVYTCGPGMCNVTGLPDQTPIKFVERSRWKDWRSYN